MSGPAVIAPGNGAVPEPPSDAGNALPPGTRLGEFELAGVIGAGGFGIVYRAYDHSLQRHVAIKEYMPASLAARPGRSRVEVKSARHAETFHAGMRSFINEARLLARFDHPALLKVYRFWEDHGTAYMAMPCYQGRTLTQTLREMGGAPGEAWLRAMLAPLLDALETMHAEDCLHRDIAPDNILMLANGQPLLLDFGAARRAIAGMAQNFTVILKPGYAPVEQYAETGAMPQGPWTDIYALGAVLHFAITGRPPAPSVARMVADAQPALAGVAAGRYSDAFLAGIDRALAVRPEHRPQSIAALRDVIGLSGAPRPPEPFTPEPPPPSQWRAAEPTGPRGTEPPGPSLSQGTGAPEPRMPQGPGRARPRAVGHTSAILATRARRAAVAALLLAAAAGVYLATREWNAPSRRAASPAPTQTPTPPPTQTQTQTRPPAGDTAPAPLDPIAVLDRIALASNRDHAVTVGVAQPRVRIGVDRLRFSVRSSRAGYVYLLMVGTDRSQFWLLFPNRLDGDNRVDAGGALALPRPSWRMTAAGPPGVDHLLALVSESPRDFSAAGLRANPPFAEFPVAALARAAGDARAGTVFAGVPRCPAGAACPASYGAALFSIEETAAP
ncbi:serine/threonine-protein kinase [Pseudoduganella namucuonensis]|uniref:Protein kinase domain-containing protein n=1 Tax=Pseudoduganella namucuonensis TaxID=1035707 RepID=A0A1I7KPE1_9BURK|nr:serine/threonine-protein kinase [Pseudoduganella namucuonensis]SFU99280.1 hypothetical protein SAMN05216552_101894 [Pseudoduganella namucuonensis]